MAWDPDQYLKFQAQRFLPFEDCLKLIDVRPKLRVIDLGCGTGELTARLKDALPESDVLGIDSSAEMLQKTKPRPGLRYEQQKIEELDGKWDLIFSHAAIHWVDDHARLIPNLLAHLARGGQLVVQQPSNHHHVAHEEVRATAREEPFARALGGWERAVPVLTIGEYAQLLHDAGGRELVVFEKVYPHVLPDSDAVVEWTRGTTLVPLLERLPRELHEPFLARYRERLRVKMPASPLLYGFQRILFSARVQ